MPSLDENLENMLHLNCAYPQWCLPQSDFYCSSFFCCSRWCSMRPKFRKLSWHTFNICVEMDMCGARDMNYRAIISNYGKSRELGSFASSQHYIYHSEYNDHNHSCPTNYGHPFSSNSLSYNIGIYIGSVT
jgi:hypothetical protein